jgi:secretion/DNA translocation related TadE-like protein
MPIDSRLLEKGSASALVIGLIAALSSLFLALSLGFEITLGKIVVQQAADAAAVAVADTVAGNISGLPCENAMQISQTNGATVISCRIVGFGATLEVEKNIGLWRLSAIAEAAVLDSVQ